eukprot:CAMPEP_0181289890 /NCGR_PEP_ID=MMETSP1101-20121128/1124_1 /TAXON_ID=46948 /ORGANISM="Rhodomonas abbreviata, Strain Caron Lab Isolate" /LENGTH=550 /DNA_ID=CAMNT_0023394143 /DNA_START=127 /DNA_END=1776 /DNA_ORIENTATION=-
MLNRVFGSASRPSVNEAESSAAAGSSSPTDLPDDDSERRREFTAAGTKVDPFSSVPRSSFVPNFRGRTSMAGMSAAELGQLPDEMRRLVETQGLEMGTGLAGQALESLSQGLSGNVQTESVRTWNVDRENNLLPRKLISDLTSGGAAGVSGAGAAGSSGAAGGSGAPETGTEGAALGRQILCLHCHRAVRSNQLSAAFCGTCAVGCVYCHKKCLGTGPESLLAPFATSPGMLYSNGNVVLDHPGLQNWNAIVDGDGVVRIYVGGQGVRCAVCVPRGQTPGRRRTITDAGAETAASEDGESDVNSRDDALVTGTDPGTLVDGHGGRDLAASQALASRLLRLMDLEYNGTPDAGVVDLLEGALAEAADQAVTNLLVEVAGLDPETGAFPMVVDWAKLQDTLLQLVSYSNRAGEPVEPEAPAHSTNEELRAGLRTLHTLLDPDGPPEGWCLGLLRRYMARAPPEIRAEFVNVVGWDSAAGRFTLPDQWPRLLRSLRAGAAAVGGETSWFEARAELTPPPQPPLPPPLAPSVQQGTGSRPPGQSQLGAMLAGSR